MGLPDFMTTGRRADLWGPEVGGNIRSVRERSGVTNGKGGLSLIDVEREQ